MAGLTGKQTSVTLNNDAEMPSVGFGTWTLRGETAVKMIKVTFDAGYRLIDSAAMYDNEEAVGRAVREADLPREEVFITTKLSNHSHGYEQTLRGCNESLRRLGMDSVDLYLIHWPREGSREETWRAMEVLYEQGKARAVGVSNYRITHLEDVLRSGSVKPAVNQIELHPFNYGQQRDVVDFCEQEGIVLEAYSPLTKGRHLDDARLKDIAGQVGKSTAQVLIRWAVQHGFVTIPRSDNPDHIRANIDVFDFKLSEEHMARLDSLS